jgi:hypothetical protein
VNDSASGFPALKRAIKAYTLWAAERGARSGVLLSLAGIILGVLFSAAAVAQEQTDGPSAIRVESQQVVVPVFVVDKSDMGFSNRGYEEWDMEVQELAVKDFHVFEDGKEQPIQNLTVDVPRVWEIHDNVTHHLETACTPKGIWASSDLPPELGKGGKGPWLIHVYLLSYIPPLADPKRPCHKIKVKVNRPHATIYARETYCSTQNGFYDALGGTELGRQMDAYADSAQEGKLQISAQVVSFFDGSSAGRVVVAADFPANALGRRWRGIKIEATIAVLGLVSNKDKLIADRFSDVACHPSLTGDAYRGPIPLPEVSRKMAELQSIPNHYETELDLPPGDYDLKLLLTDGKAFGRLELPVSVESFERDGLAISGIIFCRRYFSAPDPAVQAARAPLYSPLVANGVAFTPAGVTRFKKKDGLFSYFEIHEGRLAGAEAVKLWTQMRVRDALTGEIKWQTGLMPIEAPASSENSAISLGQKVLVDQLAPGAYRLELQASDSAGRKTVWRTASFSVEE